MTRNFVQSSAFATEANRLSGLRTPHGPHLPVSQVEHNGVVRTILERGLGLRDPYSRWVTLRDLEEMGLLQQGAQPAPAGSAPGGTIPVWTGNGYVQLSIDAFTKKITSSTAFKSLIGGVAGAVSPFPDALQQIVNRSITAEAALRGAAIQRLETSIQSAQESFAMTVSEVTASVQGSMAGGRETVSAYAVPGFAAALAVTQVSARLDDFDGLGATVEVVLAATADRVEGMAAEFFVKVTAGNKVSGFALAASEDPTGASESAFIILADSFAVVTSGTTIPDPLNPPVANIPFGVDGSGVYINGAVRINAGGTRVDAIGKAIQITAATDVFRVNAAGTASPTSIVMTATLLNSLTGSVTYSITSGTATLTSVSGVNATLTYANLTTDQATVRASVTDTGITYTRDYTIYKVVDGATGSAGSTGAAGVRGSIMGYGTPYALYLSGTSDNTDPWPAASTNEKRANRVIDNLKTGGTSSANLTSTAGNVIGDTVTLTDNPQTTAQTRYWDGTAWYKPGVVINGNLLVDGTIAAGKINVTTLSSIKANLGTVTAGSITGTAGIDITGNAIFNGTASVSGLTATMHINDGLATGNGLIGYAGNVVGAAAVRGIATAGSQFGVYGYTDTGTAVRGVANSSGGIAASFLASSSSQVAIDVVTGYVREPTGNFSSSSAGTATFTGTKPGGNTSNTWKIHYDGTTKGWIPWWAD